MKKLFFLITLLVFSTFSFSKEIVGKYLTQKDKSGQIIVEIYKEDGKIYGRIDKILEGNLTKDVNNPDKSKRDRNLLGMTFVTGFTYNEKKDKYENGRIYDPSSGNTYSCTMKVLNDGNLEFRGYVLNPLFGMTQVWTKVN